MLAQIASKLSRDSSLPHCTLGFCTMWLGNWTWTRTRGSKDSTSTVENYESFPTHAVDASKHRNRSFPLLLVMSSLAGGSHGSLLPAPRVEYNAPNVDHKIPGHAKLLSGWESLTPDLFVGSGTDLHLPPVKSRTRTLIIAPTAHRKILC